MEVEKQSDVSEMYIRFQKDLEFVQMLAHPFYISYLLQRNYFNDKAFLNYLKYLEYFRQDAYIKFIQYPQCLKMLELVQKETFRQYSSTFPFYLPLIRYLLNPEIVQEICDEQYFHWLDLGQVEKPKREILERSPGVREEQDQEIEMNQPSPMRSQGNSQGIQEAMQEDVDREALNEGAAQEQEQAPAEGGAISEDEEWLS